MSTQPWLIGQRQATYLSAALLVYRTYRLRKTPASAERTSTLAQIDTLFSRFQLAEKRGSQRAVFLTKPEASTLKLSLLTLLDVLAHKPPSTAISKEMTYLRSLIALLGRHLAILAPNARAD